jgi:hypothetical protein
MMYAYMVDKPGESLIGVEADNPEQGREILRQMMFKDGKNTAVDILHIGTMPEPTRRQRIRAIFKGNEF